LVNASAYRLQRYRYREELDLSLTTAEMGVSADDGRHGCCDDGGGQARLLDGCDDGAGGAQLPRRCRIRPPRPLPAPLRAARLGRGSLKLNPPPQMTACARAAPRRQDCRSRSAEPPPPPRTHASSTAAQNASSDAKRIT